MSRLAVMVQGDDNGSYQYDADGNRIYQMVNGVAISLAYAANSNQLVGTSGGTVASFGYDANGNTTTVNGHAVYAYGLLDRLVDARGAGIGISADGQRLRKYSSTASTYFAPGAQGGLLAEDQLGGPWSDYVWLNGRLVAVTRSSNIYAVHTDQTGRPEAITDDSQDILWRADGWAFDRTVITDTWGGFNIGFPGQYSDAETSNWNSWYNGQRDYSGQLGRYLESDPIGLAGGVNTYAYVGDNPISNVDPLGLCDQQKCAQASSVVAAIGQQISSAGSAASWTGLGIVGVSAIAAAFAPEGAPAELEGGEYGVGLIEGGAYLSTIGAGLQGYAHDGAVGALEDGVGAAATVAINKAFAGWVFSGAGHAGISGMAGLLDKAKEAMQEEAAACAGN